MFPNNENIQIFQVNFWFQYVYIYIKTILGRVNSATAVAW